MRSIFQKLVGQLRNKPSDQENFYNNGVVALASDRSEEAMALFDQALALNPGLVDAWHNKGNALFSLGRPAEALVCFDRALDLGPKTGALWSMKAEAWRL